jgi:thymidylate kinase
MRGLFVTFEGIDRSGKTTQARMLVSALGSDALGVREPGGTPAAEQIRSLLKDAATPLGPEAEALLLAAARAEIVEQVIRPALSSGRVVVYDRFVLDSPVRSENTEHEIATIRNYRSLMPLAHDARKPMFDLKAADGALGSTQKYVQTCYQEFRKLSQEILDRVEGVLGHREAAIPGDLCDPRVSPLRRRRRGGRGDSPTGPRRHQRQFQPRRLRPREPDRGAVPRARCR